MTKFARLLLSTACALALVPPLFAGGDPLAFHAWAARPTLGWNSWDFYGNSINEANTKAQADYMAANLLPHGWNLVTVDIQWYQPTATGFSYQNGAVLTMDAYGRLQPATNRFPSASGGVGFKPLADYVHSKGLRFGIHMMRGIPRQAVAQKTPVLGTGYTADQVADTGSTCLWNSDMYGVDMTKPGGQAYYNSLLNMVAAWGVDFIKIDDLSAPPYRTAEVAGIRQAIDQSGRAIVFSTSPGETPLGMGPQVVQQANQWRIRDDLWDNWSDLYDQFRLLHNWEGFRGAGYFPDADMLPLGKIGSGNNTAPGRVTKLTADEQRTMMSLWAIGRSPLIVGGDLTQLDAATLALLTNDEVLAVNQASLHNRQLFRTGDLIAWTADVEGSADKYLGVFNATGGSASVPVTLAAMGFTGACAVHSLWDHTDLGLMTGTFSPTLPSHGSALYRVSGATGPVPWINGTVPGNGKVALAWDTVPGAGSYKVKRAASEAGAYTTIADGLTGTSYTDPAAQNNTTYFYAVSAVVGGKETPNSGARSALPMVAKEIIGWNFDLYGTVSGASVAGVVPAANWNNSFPNNFVADLVSSLGGSTTVGISYASAGSYSIQNTHPGADANGTYNRELLNGYLNSGDNQVPTDSTVTITQIPYSVYDLYVYFSSDTAGRTGTITDGTTTFSFKTLGSASISGSNAVLTPTTDTAGGNPPANYAVFTGLTSSRRTLTCHVPAFGGIAAFQIVPRTGPLSAAGPLVLPGGVIGDAYSQPLVGSGGSSPYQWSLAAGVLPPGLSLASNGVLSGTPSTVGTFTFTVQVDDSAASSAATDLTLAVLSQFGAWETGFFTPGELADATVSGPTADPDHDGISNLLEFATNHHPRTADGTVLAVDQEVDPNGDNTYLTGTYTRRKAVQGITYHVEVSSGCATWQEGVNCVREMQVIDDGNGTTETVKVHSTVPASASPRQFLRLCVTQP